MKLKKVLAITTILSILCSFTACGTASKRVTREERDAGSSVSEVVFSEEAEDETVSEEEVSSEESEEESETESAEESEAESEVSEAESKLEDESKSESKLEDESKAESKDEEENSESSKAESEDGAFVYEGVSIVLPENFTVQDSSASIVIAYPDTYPQETDNVNFTKTNESVAVYSKENINKTMKTLFDGYKGCENYKQYKIDGYDAVSYNHTINVSDVDVEQTQLVVFADSTVIITFTSISGNYDDAFQKAIDSVKVVD